VHGRRLACGNGKYEVFFDDIEWAGGERVRDYLVVAPRAQAPGLVSGVAVLPVVDGKFALIRVYRRAIDEHAWEVPRGFVDRGEAPLAAALRELGEETGLACRPADMLPLGAVAPEGGLLAGRLCLYAALDCTRARPFDAAEFGHHELRLFEPAEMAGMAANSQIQDPGTLVAYYRYRALPDRGRTFD